MRVLRARLRNPLLWLVLLLVACGAGVDEKHPKRIVLVVVDTLRRDHIGAYGAKLATPNMDALAARGQVFQNLVASFHQTSMSMAAMFTGRTPSIESGDPRETVPWNSSTWCGLHRFASRQPDETCIPKALPTLAERLRADGYRTVGVASNQFLYEPSGFGRGFDTWIEVDRRKPVAGPASREGVEDPQHSRYWRTVNAAALEAAGRRPDAPLFLYVHYIDVHDYRIHERSYAEGVAVMDAALGELLEGLEGLGLLDDAVVVLTSDHGERLGEDHHHPGELPNNYGHFGNPSFEEVLRVPLIVAPPVFEDTTRMLRTQDLYYLIQEIAGLRPEPVQDTEPDELFVGERNYRTYRKGKWKVSVRRSDGRAFLYDLAADPGEQENRAKQHRMVVLTTRMRINALSKALESDDGPQRTELSDEDRERLRSLGYLEHEEAREAEEAP